MFRINSNILNGLVIWLALATFSPAVASEPAPWHPVAPTANDKDWVQLNSGEWVRGSIDLMRDLEMQFDSDKLDDLIIDWADIKAFRSPHVLTFVFTRGRVATGTSSMQDGVITVTTEAGDLQFARRELLSIIEPSNGELDQWSAKGSVGMTARSGNTDQTDFNALARLRREAARSQFNMSYTGNFSETSGNQTTNNHRGTGDLKFFLSRKFYVTPLSVELYGDKFQNIALRSTVGAGAGYYFYRTSALEWSVGLGGAYRRTDYISVQPGQSDVQETGSVVPSTYFNSDVTSDIELEVSYSGQIGVPDPRETTHHAAAVLSVDLVGDILELSTSITWDRVETPKPNADGVVPRRDDFRFVLGLGVDL